MVFSFEVVFPAAPTRTTRVVAGRGALALLGREVPERFRDRLAVVVSDDRVFPLHGRTVVRSLEDKGLRCESLVFPQGEGSKTRETKAALEDGLLRLGAGRDTVIVAVGGGVTGDLAGFLASTWHRGIPVVQAPTSLLAMTDAALGGKTAVNLPGGKNLVGAFHQPWGLFADLDVLDTLPDRELRAGLTEAVKSAAVADLERFAVLEADVAGLVARDPSALERAVRLGLEVKARFATADETERGRRAALNFGHTVAHALEAASGFSLHHGEAVAVGLVAEARLAARRFGFPREDVERIRLLLRDLGLPVSVPAGVDAAAVLAAARHDKKNRGGSLRVSVPERLGRMAAGDDPTREIGDADFLAALAPAD